MRFCRSSFPDRTRLFLRFGSYGSILVQYSSVKFCLLRPTFEVFMQPSI